MAGVELIKVKPEDDGMRLNRWFLKYYPQLPLSRLQKLLRTKQIKVDGKRSEAAFKLAAGQEIRIPPLNEVATVREKSGITPRDEAFIKSLVIYKDDNIIVLNKPSGLAVQGGTNTLRHIDGMLEALKFEKPEAPRLVHRIDKDTSGILVLARDRKNAELLTAAFKKHDLQKTYLALVKGCPKADAGEIKAPLLKTGEKSQVSAEGKKAVTRYRILDHAGSKFALVEAEPLTGRTHLLDHAGSKFALVEAEPLTGRTHQIRAHLEYIGTPIVGDDKYYGEKREKFTVLKDKLYLHAYKIDLSGIYDKVRITAALPEHFAEALEVLGLQI